MIHECKYETSFRTPCGCVLAKCEICGVIKSLSKCVYHTVAKGSSREYYINGMGCIVEGIPQHTRVSQEMELALGTLKGVKAPGSRVLEIGAGLGLYAPMCLRYGYEYEALEIDHWAAQYIRGAYGVVVHELPFEMMPSGEYDIIIAAHVLEHLFDAKQAVHKIHKLLKEDGVAYILIPNDDDLCNPDHHWFFNQENVKVWMEEAGFDCIEIIQKKIVLHEHFIYIKATKIKK